MGELRLAKLESFYVGGERKPLRNSLGHEDEAIVGAMYVQHLVPAELTLSVPVVMVHGGCHTGVTWETTPDGREGWATLFVRAGIETYVVDQPWRGRSAFALTDGPSDDPLSKPSNIGLSAIEAFARGGGRFPLDAADHYGAQLAPDHGVRNAAARGQPGSSDPRALPAFLSLMDRIGCAALVTHSQGADIGWKLAVARPTQIAAILAIEPGMTVPGLDDPAFPVVPVNIIWGDNLPERAIALSQADLRTAQDMAARKPHVTVDHLPEGGICGNGHMLMMEDNSAELAERAIGWLRRVTALG